MNFFYKIQLIIQYYFLLFLKNICWKASKQIFYNKNKCNGNIYFAQNKKEFFTNKIIEKTIKYKNTKNLFK